MSELKNRMLGEMSGSNQQMAPTTTTTVTAGRFPVETPLGTTAMVATFEDQVFYQTRRQAYEDDFTFESASDRSGLGTLLDLEVTLTQIQRWVSTGSMDNGAVLRPTDVSRYLTQSNALVRQIESQKKSLGMDRESRMRATAENVGTYISTLLIRAKEYGVSRNEEVIKAVDLWRALQGIVERFDRSNDFERLQAGFVSEADIVEWIRKNLPDMDAIDERFRKGQRSWVGTL